MPRLFFLFLLLYANLAWAQQRLHIETDKAFYATGESMGVLITNSSEEQAEIIYLEILDDKSQILANYTTRSDGRIASVKVDIPLDWESSWYVIRAYNIWIPSIEIKDLGVKAVAIYNEFDKSTVNTTPEPIVRKAETASFGITTNKKSYVSGEEVMVTIDPGSASEESSFVISVMDKASHDQLQAFKKLEPSIPVTLLPRQAEVGELQQKLLYLGKLETLLGNSLAALYIAEEKDFSWLSLNEEQVFGMEMEDFWGSKHAQVLGLQAIGGVSYLKPEIFTPSQYLPKLEYEFGPLPYTKAVVHYLESARKRRIIADLYDKSISAVQTDSTESLQFIKADKSYSPKDYIQFSDTKDFIQEVASFARLRQDDQGYYFHVMMERNTLAPYPPVMFLNGYILQDAGEIVELEINEIDRIDIFRKEKTILREFKTLGRNGVIAVYTKDGTKRPKSGNNIEIKGFQRNHSLIQPSLAKDLPDFSPRLYWNAQLSPNNSGIISCSFPLSDDKGEYIIRVQNYSKSRSTSKSQSIVLE